MRISPVQPWTAYAAGSDVGDFREFCHEHLIQSVDRWDGEPLDLEEWQLDLFGEALAYDEAGAPLFTSTVIILPRKNGKTAMLAAYAVWKLLSTDGHPEILLAASSDRQAQRLFEACSNFIRKNLVLRDLARIRDHAGEIRREDGEGAIYRMSSDPGRLHGFNPSLVIIDELHTWTTPSLRRAYAALTTGGGARSAPQTFSITTAGEASQRKSSILGQIIDGAVGMGEVETKGALTIARHHSAGMIIFNWEAQTSDPQDTVKIKEANPASWISEEFLLKQAQNPELTTAQFLQLHGCVWAETTSTYVNPIFLSQAQGSFLPLSDGDTVVLGFDGSERRDETWLVACSLDGRVEPLGRWQNPGQEDWRVPRNEVHRRVKEAFDRFDVREFAFDPPGWYAEGDFWATEYGEERVVEFPTNRPARMAPACERTQTALQEGEMSFGGLLGNDLAAHFGNCVTRETPAGLVVQKDHGDSPRKIDGAVASIIAFDRACWHAVNSVSTPWAAFA